MRDGLLALLCVPALAACSYDWAVPADASTEGGFLDASGSDAAKDADAGITDAPPSADAGAMDVSVTDAPDVVEAAPLPECTSSQEMTVQQDRAAALDCTGVTPMPCETTVTDECGCPVVVATTNTAEATYLAAIKSLQATCIPLCPSGCGTAPQKGVCIVGDAGGGSLACYQ
jgi:hypothetical protein